jgi:hypothetical protein
MGRPLNKKYFANTNYQDFGTAGVGGESTASVAVTGTFGSKTPGTYDIPASVISAPGVTGGAKPTLTLTYLTASTASVAVVTPGSGYLTAVTISGAALQALGGAGTGTIVLTATMTANGTSRQNGIKCEAQIGAGTEVTTGDIIKQVSDIRFKVQTSDGTAICKLVQTADLNANEMTITATDANSNAYFIRRITSRTCIVERKVSGDGDFATGAKVKWTFGSAAAGTVSIENQ